MGCYPARYKLLHTCFLQNKLCINADVYKDDKKRSSFWNLIRPQLSKTRQCFTLWQVQYQARIDTLFYSVLC
jgi:hypothetical protein